MKTIDRQLAAAGEEIRQVAHQVPIPPWRVPGSRRSAPRLVALVTALAGLFAAIAIPALWLRSSDPLDPATSPAGFGTWKEIAAAPIDPRPRAIGFWTGTEVIFWAGSSLGGSTAYTDGAVYDPAADEWRLLDAPGWGHPGLTGVFFEGELYTTAKNGGARFDPATGIWADLPMVDRISFAGTVATDRAVWGVGPGDAGPDGAAELAITRYEPNGDRWIAGPAFRGSSMRSLFRDSAFLNQPVLWTGSKIVVWNPDGKGVAFDPDSESWKEFPPLLPPTGLVESSVAAASDDGLVVVAKVMTNGHASIFLATYENGTWGWRELPVVIQDLSTASMVTVQDWALVFSADGPPITVHLQTGSVRQEIEGPLAGLRFPSTVWTGDRLIVWGGASVPTEKNPDPSPGAAWIPPAD